MTEEREELSTDSAFNAQFDSSILRLRTVMLAQVVAFNLEQNTVDVQPCIKRKFIKDETPGNLPIISDVPVAYFGGGGFWLTIEPKSGDYCVLMVSDRSIEAWKSIGGVVDPQIKRHHDMTDSIAYFGINPFNDVIPEIEPETMHLRSKDGQTGIKLTASNAVIHIGGNDILTVGADSVASTVNITAPDFITDSGISLNGHIHTGDSGGDTSPPK